MSRWVDFMTNSVGLKFLSIGAKRAVLWAMGSTVTAASVAYDIKTHKGHSKIVIPAPASEGFKDAFMEDLLSTPPVLTENQSVEWLNHSIEPMWPFLDEGIRQVVLEKLEPAIQNAVPLIGKQLRFAKLTLGCTAPQLGPVTSRLTEDGVELFVAVDYAGDLELEFELGVATVSIADLTIRGEVMLAFKPLVNGINPIGGMEISCLDQPEVTLKLSAKGMFLDSVPNFYKLLKYAVDDAVASILVMPNNIAFRIPTVTGPVTDIASLKYRSPLGVLRVSVDSAQHLPGSTWSTNPYARVQVGAHHYYTDTVNKNVNPTWHGKRHTQDFMIFHSKQSVRVDVFSGKGFGADELIGSCQTPVSTLVGLKDKELMTLPVKTAIEHYGHHGGAKLKLQAEWLPLSDYYPDAAESVKEIADDPREKWRDGNSGGTGNQQLTTLRVDKVFTSHGPGPHKVVMNVGGRSTATCPGTSPPLIFNICPSTLCEITRRMSAANAATDLVCSVLEIDETDYLQYKKTTDVRSKTPFPLRDAEVECTEDEAWAKAVISKMKRNASDKRPQFDEILYLPSKLEDTFDISLQSLTTVDGKPTYATVASKEFPLSQSGPFHLDGCTVFATPTVSYLGKATEA
eukprot:TRINITY_DN9749_c0_g1_i1.p1 TRINITY_DN9749_c0_g1~~TRINITY_DN9749_c0_g1_i1.p1  ORF type:complete len:627 (+),score=121.20 TRINITY_DN9749_c0_g1_i1:839-2719(+)